MSTPASNPTTSQVEACVAARLVAARKPHGSALSAQVEVIARDGHIAGNPQLDIARAARGLEESAGAGDAVLMTKLDDLIAACDRAGV